MSNETIYHDQDNAIRELFVGRRVVEVNKDAETLTLDNGTVVQVVPNVGGCICGAGDYWLENLTSFDHAITGAAVDEDENDGETRYRLFVYAEGLSTAAATVVGDDGNGYYGTGFSLTVREAGA